MVMFRLSTSYPTIINVPVTVSSRGMVDNCGSKAQLRGAICDLLVFY